jgi:hypothetical protein
MSANHFLLLAIAAILYLEVPQTASVDVSGFNEKTVDCEICRENSGCSKPAAVRVKLGPGGPANSMPKPAYPKEAIDAQVSGLVRI